MCRESPFSRDNMRILTLVCSTFVILGSNDAKPTDDDDRLVSAIIDDPTNPPSRDGSNDNDTMDDGGGGAEPLLPPTKSVQNRTAHARMSPLEDLFPRRTTSTTLMPPTEYDYWWRFTTPRRPRYRDFPGKPGVATWKEISPSVVNESKRDRKTTSPTAAEVLSGAPKTSITSMLSAIMSCTLLILNGYHRPLTP